MIRRFLVVAVTLAVGASTCAGLYWLFLNTPESNTLALTASAVLAVAIGVAAALAVNTAVLLAKDRAVRAATISATRGVWWFGLAAVPLGVGWWAVGRVDTWVGSHAGEINAWFIARFGWTDVSQLLRAEMWLSRWARWAVFPLLSLSLLARLLGNEDSAPGRSLLRRAWHWRTLAMATLVFVLLFAVPWQLTAWRPKLPATWIEPAVAALRLGVVAALGVSGAAILVLLSARDRVTK